MDSSIIQQKTQLRRAMLTKLRAVLADDSVREARSKALRDRLAPWLCTSERKTVALYASLEHELDLLPLLDEYPQHRYGFPRCDVATRGMDFYHITDQATQLQSGAHGIREPRDAAPLIAAHEFDLIIVPGVAFTREGARLGYGGGYYDRYLSRASRACLIALACEEQVLDCLPTEDHDRSLDDVLIESASFKV